MKISVSTDSSTASNPYGAWDAFAIWNQRARFFAQPDDTWRRAFSPLLNQAALTIQRPLDPKATDYDLGFKIQALYGSDARYVQYLGEFNYAINDRTQIALVEAWGAVHLPWLFTGGIDVKAGQWVTLEGAETTEDA